MGEKIPIHETNKSDNFTDNIPDDEIDLSMYRIRIPELMFQPMMAGIDQAGVAEMLSRVINDLPKDCADLCSRNFYLIGGNCAYPSIFDLNLI